MLFDDLSGDVETETEAAIIFAGDCPLETPKNSRKVIGGDTNAVILDDQHRFLISGLQLDINRMAGAVLYCVGKDIGKRFIQTESVPLSDDSAA